MRRLLEWLGLTKPSETPVHGFVSEIPVDVPPVLDPPPEPEALPEPVSEPVVEAEFVGTKITYKNGRILYIPDRNPGPEDEAVLGVCQSCGNEIHSSRTFADGSVMCVPCATMKGL